MLVQGWSWRYREPGRRSRSGERSRPGGEGGHNHLRSRWPITQGRMRAHAVVMPPPALDDDPTSVTPIARIASATGVPCATRTSTWRSFATISSGVCLFLPIVILLRLSRAILQDGPLQRGRITYRTDRADHDRWRKMLARHINDVWEFR